MEELLLAWFEALRAGSAVARTRDPYAILVSEVMLQQTQVERVIPRWVAWLERWPTPAALAAATPADVIRAWQGLGYNRRAVSLHRAARPSPTRLARGAHRTAGGGPVHRGRDPESGVRRGGAAGRHERRPDPGAHRPHFGAGGAAGALRPRRDHLPRSRTALRACPLAGGCPSRGLRYEPLRKQSRFEGSFRQRRARYCARSRPSRSRSRRWIGRPSTRSCGTAWSSSAGGLVRLPA